MALSHPALGPQTHTDAPTAPSSQVSSVVFLSRRTAGLHLGETDAWARVSSQVAPFLGSEHLSLVRVSPEG